MANNVLPEKVRLFIYQYIDSVELLEILCYLKSIAPEWKTPQQVSLQLRLNQSSASRRLEKLRDDGLVESNSESHNSFRYAPAFVEMDEVVNMLIEEFKIKPHRIYEEMFSPLKRVRQVADAFVIRKRMEKKEDGNG